MVPIHLRLIGQSWFLLPIPDLLWASSWSASQLVSTVVKVPAYLVEDGRVLDRVTVLSVWVEEVIRVRTKEDRYQSWDHRKVQHLLPVV
jgi:hypothetical protein